MATTTNLDVLKINYLTERQYETEKTAGRINPNELYLTPASGGGSSEKPILITANAVQGTLTCEQIETRNDFDDMLTSITNGESVNIIVTLTEDVENRGYRVTNTAPLYITELYKSSREFGGRVGLYCYVYFSWNSSQSKMILDYAQHYNERRAISDMYGNEINLTYALRSDVPEIDSSITDTTSTNVPTTAAVVNYINSLNRNGVSY